MGLFATLEQEARQRELPFLVIGGLAVNFYGYSRDTADLDLLVCGDQRSAWLQLLATLKYAVFHDADTFVQLSPPAQGEWPVDLMVVQAATFTPMLSAGLAVEMFGTRVVIPSLEHLLALKLHALKHAGVHRFLKDFQDVEGLVRINRLDLKSEKIRQLFFKYGSVDLYEKIVRACSDN